MSATISDCGRYRYDLDRETGEGAGSVLWVMLNPSTADATNPDPTITRCIGFTKRWNFARLKVVNLFAYRSAYPEDLRTASDIVDLRNIKTLLDEVSVHDRVVFAWGGGLKYAGTKKWMADYAARIFQDAQCFGLNGDGTPKHPLYLKYETELVPYTWAQSEGREITGVIGEACRCTVSNEPHYHVDPYTIIPWDTFVQMMKDYEKKRAPKFG